jgi:hypothetical protein
LRPIFRFDSPFRSGETGSVGKRVQDSSNVRIIRKLLQRGKLTGQIRRNRNKRGKITEGDETMENFNLEVQLEDLMIRHDDI